VWGPELRGASHSWSSTSRCALGVIPLIDVEAGDFLDALSGQHEDTHGAGVRRMHRRVRAFEPAIELDKLLLAEPAGPDDLGLRWNAGCGIDRQLEPARGGAAVVVLGLHAPRVGRPNEAAHVVGHGGRPTRVDRPQHAKHVVGGDVAGSAASIKDVGGIG
jgi:hypothetical protein